MMIMPKQSIPPKPVMPDMKYRDSCKNRKYLCDIQIYLFFLKSGINKIISGHITFKRKLLPQSQRGGCLKRAILNNLSPLQYIVEGVKL
jgi:hypothetical protein